jgi:hypothetical protein
VFMLTGFTLVVLAVLFRFVSDAFHTWNLVPMGAIALYAGARLPRRWAWLVPVAGMILSDLVIDYGRGRSLYELWRWVSYATLGATSLIGPLARVQKLGSWRYPALSLAASTLFFLTSNFAVWTEGRLYPMTMAGLVECYYLGLFFFGRTIVADLAGTAVLFGLGPAVERAVKRLGLTHPAKSAAEVELPQPLHTG